MSAKGDRASEKADLAQRLVLQIKPLLAGKGPIVQGAVLADLVAIWLRSHEPSIRGDALFRWVTLMHKLAALNDPWAEDSHVSSSVVEDDGRRH